MRRSWVVAGVLGLAMATSVAALAVEYTPGATTAGDPYFPRYGNGGYDVEQYDLDVRYDPDTDRLTATATVTAVAEQPLSAFTLDLVGLTVAEATVDGAAAGVSHVGRKLTLTPTVGIGHGQTFTTVVSYSGIPTHVDNRVLGRSGWFHTDDGAIVVGEPASAAFWFPVNDHPSDKARLSVDVTVPAGLRALSNGVASAPTTEPDGWRTFHWGTRDPMASYLATVAIGRFRVDRIVHGGGMVVTTAVDASLGRYVDRQLQRTGEVFRFLRRHIGDYPFEAVGGIVDVAPLGFALETQTIPVYSDLFFSRGRDSSWVIAHELAHQWFGDSVSLRRWRDIWLNEGFATYFEWVWTAEQSGSTAYRTAARLYDRLGADDLLWDVVIGDPGRRNLFHPAVYYRGAMTVAQLEHRLGERRFDRLVTRWIARYRGSDATTRDFVRLAEDTCGCGSLDRLFDQWLYTPGKPHWR